MKDIGIIGGGIGGMAAAAALRRLGVAATVHERAASLQEAGAGMMLWPNATRVLKGLGLLDKIAAISGSSTHFLVRASSGEILMKIALGAFDVPALCTRRADLLAALCSAVPGDRIQFGRDFRRLEELSTKVRIHFSDGTMAEHDAVIGADGIRSRVRTQMFGVSNPILRGYSVWRGIGTYSGSAIGIGENSETWGRGSRFGILDMGQGRYTWYATANISTPESIPPERRKSDLLRRFAGWHEPIADLIDSTRFILENRALDLPPLLQWSRGRVTLLGDAAHACTPNLGQGGSLALEDALVLAKCIARDSSLESALHSYERLRHARTRHIQQRSRWMGRIGQWQNGAVVTGRQVVTRLLPASLFEQNLRRVYSYEA